ncbi:hypothetical protein C8F01DRAFT_1158517 [Mycena amicta]|nr:hypothetical protein C8F01DRAFT_1158517 [Mycena amicta]
MFGAGAKVLLLLANAGIFLSESGSAVLGANAVTLVPTNGDAFDPQTLMPPVGSSADLVFNWHDDDNSGDNNTIATAVYMMSDGGNTTISDSSVPGYVIEAVAVQFNSSHFSSKALDFPWLAIFPCTKDSKAGNSSALVSNAERLGAVAILAYTEGAFYSWCNLTDNNPAATIPIYATEYWARTAVVFSDQLGWLFSPTTVPFYDPTALSALSTNISADFSALNSESFVPVQTKSPALLARIPAIGANVTAAAAQAIASASASSASESASAASAAATPKGGAIGLRPSALLGVGAAIFAMML